jgi:hypothetical protein
MKRSWIFLTNPFIVATNGSYSKMKQIGDVTLAALAARVPTPPADDIFSQLLTALTPLVQAYDDVYAAWVNQQGATKGQTQTLNDLLDELRSQKIEDWDLAIQNVYRQKTPQYMALLPRHRAPFQSGSQQQRITAVAALSLAIGTDAALQTLKTDVDAFYDELTAALNNQKGGKSIKSASSSEVEAERIALGTGLYGVLGRLMDYYKEMPETIADIIPVDALRNNEQTIFQHDVKGGVTRLVFTRTLEDGESLKCVNRGNTALQLALVHEKNDAMPETAYTLHPNEEELVTPEVLGAKGNRFLIVKNLSTTEKGAYTITLV